MGTEKGGMTLFLSLLLAGLISFLCTALQSARMAGSRYLFTLASEAAVKSMFAAYDTRVWEQYRILALSDETLAAQIGQECTQVYGGNGTLFSVSVSEMEITGRQTGSMRRYPIWKPDFRWRWSPGCGSRADWLRVWRI